jgi:hypothetical protein
MNDEILERLAALYTSGKPLRLTVTIRRRQRDSYAPLPGVLSI